MFQRKNGLVRALLPILPMAMCHGCGSDGSPEAARNEAQSTPITSVSANRAPTIGTVTDEYARVGETFVYLPIAGDPDGDKLQFSAENLPPWASIDPTDGRVTGTPGPDDLGVYESITITAADASRQAVTKPFSITVVSEAASGVASLRWEVPPSKVDGSPLDDLAGYRILYGQHSDDLDHSVLIDNANTTSYEFTTLTRGIWYFAVVAVNSGGLEGPPTITASKSI